MRIPNILNIFGSNGGLTLQELESLTYRSKFSDYLPWIAYDAESHTYLNVDDTAGFLWECAPLAFAGESTETTLQALFRINFPKGSILQFILYADSHIEPYLDAYRRCKSRENPMIRSTTEAACRYFTEGTKGLPNLSGIPIRNFRLFVSAKLPIGMKGTRAFEEIHTTIRETLRGASLNPTAVPPGGLLDWMRRLFNANPSMNNSHYDETTPLRKQVILSETQITKDASSMRIGERTFRCTTPRVFPKEVDLFQTSRLFGGCWGLISDGDQIRTPFLYTLNILFHDMKSHLHKKCNIVLWQKGVGSFARSLARKQEEFAWATDELEKKDGNRFLRILPMLWVWDSDERAASESVTRAKRIWESCGYIMQEDKGILPVLLISSLPFGLYDKGGNIDHLDRDFIAQADSIGAVLPVQSDFSGGGAPVVIFIGRKGQLINLDIYDKQANNHNMLVAATSGGGKSFLLNYLVYNYWSTGALIRMIDIGHSYRKICNMAKGRFLDFDEHSKVSFNPFTNIRDINEDISEIAAIILQMVFSATDAIPAEIAETATSLVKAAARWAYKIKGADAEVDDAYEYLRAFPKYFEEDAELFDAKMLKPLSQNLAFNLLDFVRGGAYHRWFRGKCSLNIADDEFVVLELENLLPKKELFKVVALQVINEVTQGLYLSDRSRRQMIFFEEAPLVVEKCGMLLPIMEGGFRRARRYSGSFNIVTQSVLDRKVFGPVGDVIWGNTAFKCYLQSPDFEKAREEKLIDYDPFTMKLLKSVKSNRPNYSEIFLDTPFGVGVARLTVDPYSYYVYTSTGVEVAEIEGMVAQGMSYDEAICEMVRKYRS